MLAPTQPEGVVKKELSFNLSLRFIVLVVVTQFLVSLAIPMPSASAASQAQMTKYRIYALLRINDWTQFECFNQIMIRESQWNPSAKNGSHYGIPQAHDIKAKYLDPFSQIDWAINYIRYRYKGDSCLALKHSNKFGWY